jgi:cytochrome c oxidase cbb3-type subunit 3
MTSAWSLYVIALVAANVLGCVWLLWWTAKRRGDAREESTTGHAWDDDLTEYNKPLPRWWLNLFYATIVFGVGYLAVYPGLGNFAGTLGWTSDGEHAAALAAEDAKVRASLARFDALSVAELAANGDAVALGGSLFASHCAACHGSDARGAKGYPNLTDKDWLWGGDPERVLETVVHGRTGAMPALGGALGDSGVVEVAVYVQSLAGGAADAALAHRGRQRFAQICAACHGVDGKGNPALGAPNLTDDVWLYGGTFEDIAATIRSGRNGSMPAHGAIIGAERARLAAAWVLSLQLPPAAEAGAGK